MAVGEGFIEYPRIYGAVDVDLNETIFLEDLSIRNFSIIDRFTQDMTADHVRLIMHSLGKFHAISLSLKDQQSQKFDKLASPLVELFFRQDLKTIRDFYNSTVQTILKALPGEQDESLRSKVTNVFDKDVVDIAADCLNAESAAPASVIRHGDVWQNNIMFKHDEHGKPTEISLLDWQISYHSTPIADIVHFIFSCTTKELRDAHYDEFLQIYHTTLTDHVRKYA